MTMHRHITIIHFSTYQNHNLNFSLNSMTVELRLLVISDCMFDILVVFCYQILTGILDLGRTYTIGAPTTCAPCLQGEGTNESHLLHLLFVYKSNQNWISLVPKSGHRWDSHCTLFGGPKNVTKTESHRWPKVRAPMRFSLHLVLGGKKRDQNWISSVARHWGTDEIQFAPCF